MFNVSGTKLDAGMTAAPAGSSHGPNIRGANQPYMGPRTPAGPKHRYHLQVFALDTTLAPEAGTTYDGFLAAMKDHVLASGETDRPGPGGSERTTSTSARRCAGGRSDTPGE